MTDTIWFDVSEFNPPLSDVVLKWDHWCGWVACRANDGTYKDKHWNTNRTWAQSNAAKGNVIGWIAYMVWRPNYYSTLSTFKQQVGNGHHPHMVVMIDVESWNGEIKGDQSTPLNQTYDMTWRWLFSLRPKWQKLTPGLRYYFQVQDRKRVIGYFNASDMKDLWPSRPKGMNYIIANYDTNPQLGQTGHQFSRSYPVPGYATVDMNSADGIAPHDLARKFGLVNVKVTS